MSSFDLCYTAPPYIYIYLLTLALLCLLGKKSYLNIKKHITLITPMVTSDNNLLSSLALWIANCKQLVFLISGSFSTQLENLSSQIFHDGYQVDRITGINYLSRVIFIEKMVEMINGKLKSSMRLTVCFFPCTLPFFTCPGMMIVKK